MANETVERRYATAVFALAQEASAVDAVGRDLRTVADTIQNDDEIRRFYEAPVIKREEKEKIIGDAFGRLHEIALHTLLLLIKKRREMLLLGIVREYETLALAASGRESLLITTSHELSPTELQALVERLSRLYRKEFDVRQQIDPGLIGGVRITMGDRRIDGSVAGALDELARTLSKN